MASDSTDAKGFLKRLLRGESPGEVVKRLAPSVDGRGGGKANLAQAGGKAADKLPAALDAAPGVLEALLG